MMHNLERAPQFCEAEFDFIRSSELGDWTFTGGTASQVAAAGGALRLATDASDNTQCSGQLDIAPMILGQGTYSIKSIFNAPTDVDNMDAAIGFLTTDTDWLGDAATADEYIYVGFLDQGSSDGVTPLTLYWKNASGSGSKLLPMSVKEGKIYVFALSVTVDEQGVCTAGVQLTEMSASIPETPVAADLASVQIPYVPAGLVNPSIALQNGAAAAQSWDIDYFKVRWPRRVG